MWWALWGRSKCCCGCVLQDEGRLLGGGHVDLWSAGWLGTNQETQKGEELLLWWRENYGEDGRMGLEKTVNTAPFQDVMLSCGQRHCIKRPREVSPETSRHCFHVPTIPLPVLRAMEPAVTTQNLWNWKCSPVSTATWSHHSSEPLTSPQHRAVWVTEQVALEYDTQHAVRLLRGCFSFWSFSFRLIKPVNLGFEDGGTTRLLLKKWGQTFT